MNRGEKKMFPTCFCMDFEKRRGDGVVLQLPWPLSVSGPLRERTRERERDTEREMVKKYNEDDGG